MVGNNLTIMAKEKSFRIVNIFQSKTTKNIQ
jgi:hypothetical protein